eukprot:gene20458-27247_t
MLDVKADGQLGQYLDQLGVSEGRPVAVFQAEKIKQEEEGTGSQLLQALGARSFLENQDIPRPRFVSIMVQESSSANGRTYPSASVHLCKPITPPAMAGVVAPPRNTKRTAKKVEYKACKSFQLKRIQEFRFLTRGPTANNPQPVEFCAVLEIRLNPSTALTGTGPKDGSLVQQIGFADETQRMQFVVLVLQILRQGQSNDRLPKLQVGVSLADVDQWWKNNEELVMDQLEEWAQEALGAASIPNGSKNLSVLVSAKEERDLEELLDMYTMGLGDVEEFEQRLQEEYKALEAANVHSILTKDVDENLMVFDTKLRLMREDIAAIETSNNSLQLQSRNNTNLLAILKALLSDLKLSREMEDILENPPLESERELDRVVKAAWQLRSKLQLLTPGSKTCVSAHLLNMKVVREAYNAGSGLAARKLQLLTPGTKTCLSALLLNMKLVREANNAGSGLAARFVQRATSHLGSVINQTVDVLVQEVSRTPSGVARIQPPDHSLIHAICRRYGSLVKVLHELDNKNKSVARLHQAYGQAVNMLIRRELRMCSSELRKAAQADMHNNPIDYSLTKDSGAVVKTTDDTKSDGGTSEDRSSTVSDLKGSKAHSVLSKISQSTATSVIMVPNLSKDSGAVVKTTDDTKSDGGTSEDRSSTVSDLKGSKAHSVLPKIRQSTATSVIMVPKRRGGAHDHASMTVPLNEAYQALLDGFIPFLLNEAEVMSTFLLLYDEKEKEKEKEKDEKAPLLPFSTLVDLTSKGLQVLCLPMLATTTKWLSKLASQATGEVLANVLSACHERLRGTFVTFVAQQMSAINNYTSKAQGGVRTLHVVAFITQFALMSHHIEMMLSGSGSKLTSDRTISGLLDEVESKERRERIKTSTIWQSHEAVDELYRQLVGQMFSSLEEMAAVDVKHGERLRVENYTYFVESVRPLVQHVEVLEPYMAQAEARQQLGGDGGRGHGERLCVENYAYYFVESVHPLVQHVEVLEPYMAQA